MATKIIRRLPSILVALALCYAFQMAGFVMISPLFAPLFESFGAGVQALGASAMIYALTGKIATPFIGMLADPYPDCRCISKQPIRYGFLDSTLPCQGTHLPPSLAGVFVNSHLREEMGIRWVDTRVIVRKSHREFLIQVADFVAGTFMH